VRILFIEPYPTEGPSSRYRVEQYIPYLKSKGIECIIRPFVSSRFYSILYRKGCYLRKLIYFLQSSILRVADFFIAMRSDLVFIHLEAYPVGPPIFEWILCRLGKKMVYDLDDAIYMGMTSPAHSFLKALKWPSKVNGIVRMSQHVITCNEYLAKYARKFNKNVTIIHTSVDTSKFIPASKKGNKGVTIGWIGSHSTAPFLTALRPVFEKLSRRHKFSVVVIGGSNHGLSIPGLNIVTKD